jgi:hypothetical protein
MIITYYNAAGVVVDVESGWVTPDVVGPGQKGPFNIFLLRNLPYTSYAISMDYDVTTASPPSGVSIVNINTAPKYSWLAGELQNNNSGNIRGMVVIATFYDSAGDVVDVNASSLLRNILGSGQRGCFELGGTSHPYSSYVLVNDFYTTTDSLPQLQVLSITPTGDLHLAGQIRNNHATRTYGPVEAVGTLYDGAGKVVDCKNDYTSPYDIGPGEVVPYDIWFMSPAEWTSYSVIADGW